MHTFGLVVALCAGCGDPQQPPGPRLGVPDPNVDLGVGVGCARFQVVFDAGGAPTIEAVQNTGSCPIGELKLMSDTAGSFDPVTGTLRVAVVMENVGTVAIVPRLKLRFNADSVERLNPQGNPVGGTSDILGYLPDSSGAAGRIAFWWFDAYLAPSGQPQVLMPGARTVRRWIEFRGTTWAHKVRLKLFATGVEVGSVPAVPPDTLPIDFYDDSNVVSQPSLSPHRFVRDVIWVSFVATASAAARSGAIVGVGGTVVGGYRIGPAGGSYAVRLPRDPTHQSIFAALSVLNSNPFVAFATVEYVFDKVGAYQRPHDGQGWERMDFAVRAESGFAPAANRFSSALIAINAPLAWGCSVGDDTVRVGVIDVGLHTTGLTDLTKNLYRTSGANYPGSPDRHGTGVAMLLAARGNDSALMTGVAWRAQLSLRDATMLVRGAPRFQNGKSVSTNVRALAQIDSAVFEGVRVVNLSLGIDTSATGIAPSAVYNRGALFARGVRNSLNYAPADTPLFVVAAGNSQGADPAYSLFPVIRDSLPAHTLVVTAASRALGTARYAPPLTSRVAPDVAAPGDSVWSIDSPTTAVLATGTSYAAPLVSGTAVLLKGFDPRLSSREIRNLILQGAVASGRTAGGYPIIDAYASLKLAAERPGAPLCGNRVWAANGTVWKERTAVNGIFTDDALGTVPVGARAWIDVLHGGKRVQNETALGWQSFTWANGVWSPATNITPTSGWGGTWWSSRARDHDGTKQVDMVGSQTGASITFGVRVSSTPFSSGTTVASIGPFPAGTDSSSAVCIQLSPGCTVSVYTIRDTRAFATLAPEGDRAFVAINRRSYVPTVTTWALCPNNGAVQCAEYRNRFDVAAPTQLYEVNLTTGQVMPRWSLPGHNVSNLAMSERNDELIAAEGAFTYDEILQNNGAGQWVPISSTVIQETCTIAYRDVRVPAVSGSVLRNLAVEPASACDRTGAKGGGSMAPRIAAPGVIGPLTTSTKPSPAPRRPS